MLNQDYRARKFENTYQKCLRSLLQNPFQNFHMLPYETDTLEAAYQAEKDANWLIRTRKPKRKKRETK